MKAAVLNGEDKHGSIRIEDVATPEPAKFEVRVKLGASALNRRDYWISKGLYPDIKLPCILGSDGAGVVEAVGKRADPGLAGRKVLICPVFNWGMDTRIPAADFRILGMPDNGTFAEYICVPEANVYPVPEHLEIKEAAALPLAATTAWRALTTKACVHGGETVLITGIGGGVATMALMFAVALNARVIVTSSQDDKIRRAIKLGAIDGFNYKSGDWYRDLGTKYGGVDIVIDGNCGEQFNPCFSVLNPAGRYIVYGFTQGQPAKGFDPSKLFFRQIRIEGTTMSTPDEFRSMLEFVSKNKLHPLIDKDFMFSEAAEAIEYLGTGAQMGKIVLNLAG